MHAALAPTHLQETLMHRPLPYARSSLPSFAIAFTLLISGCATQQGLTPSNSSNAREDIFVLRSVREPQPSNTGWCTQERTGFAPLPADADRKFSFWAVQTQPSDGRIVNAKANLA